MQVVLDVVAGPIAGRKIVLQDGQGIVVGRTERASFPSPRIHFFPESILPWNAEARHGVS